MLESLGPLFALSKEAFFVYKISAWRLLFSRAFLKKKTVCRKNVPGRTNAFPARMVYIRMVKQGLPLFFAFFEMYDQYSGQNSCADNQQPNYQPNIERITRLRQGRRLIRGILRVGRCCVAGGRDALHYLVAAYGTASFAAAGFGSSCFLCNDPFAVRVGGLQSFGAAGTLFSVVRSVRFPFAGKLMFFKNGGNGHRFARHNEGVVGDNYTAGRGFPFFKVVACLGRGS